MERQFHVPARVQTYWRQLTPTERQNVLFLDEAELVKQLYKLNFSLLCVGLMQRRLLKKKKGGESIMSASPPASSNRIMMHSTASRQDHNIVDEQPPTYALLEAMEFMDIGTGIMTVKNELVQDDHTHVLFDLIQENLRGFLVQTFVLSDDDFEQLFFRESEHINTWEAYQILVAVLLEQVCITFEFNTYDNLTAILCTSLAHTLCNIYIVLWFCCC